MTDGDRLASHIATALFPAAVGPQMTRTSASPETSLNLVPRKLYDRGATVHVVRGERRIAESDVQRAHLAGRQRVSGFDRGFARDGGREPLVLCVRARLTIAGERCQRLPQTPLGVE